MRRPVFQTSDQSVSTGVRRPTAATPADLVHAAGRPFASRVPRGPPRGGDARLLPAYPSWPPRSPCSRSAGTGWTPRCCSATSSYRCKPAGHRRGDRRGRRAARRVPDPHAGRCRAPAGARPGGRHRRSGDPMLHRRARATPLIGFAGAPFTLASYLVEGGPSRDHLRTKALMHVGPGPGMRWPGGWPAPRRPSCARRCLPGVVAVQLFDSWAGALSLAEYRSTCSAFGAVLAAVADLPSRGSTSVSAPANCCRPCGTRARRWSASTTGSRWTRPTRRLGGTGASCRAHRSRRPVRGPGRVAPAHPGGAPRRMQRPGAYRQPRPWRAAGHRPGRADRTGRLRPRPAVTRLAGNGCRGRRRHEPPD